MVISWWLNGDLMAIYGDLMAIYGDFMDIHGDLVGAKVVPQFVNAKLVQISPISLGLMNGGYIYSIHGDYKPTFTSLWGHHLVRAWSGAHRPKNFQEFHGTYLLNVKYTM